MSDQDPIEQQNDPMDALAEYLQQRYQAMEGVVAAINKDFSCNLRLTCSACPVQLEGQIDGLVLYFRSRWDVWGLAIADELDSAVRARRQAEARFYHESSAGLRGFDASWLEPNQVDQV